MPRPALTIVAGMAVSLLLTTTGVRTGHSQSLPTRFLFIYRDSIKSGADSAYNAIEVHAARVCSELKCPNPYLALESLSGAHEAWWINAFTSEADTTRVVRAYAANQPLLEKLQAVNRAKTTLVGTPIQGYAVHRPELSRGHSWSPAGARFMLVRVTRTREPADGSVWEMADSSLYSFRPVQTREEAEALAREGGWRIFAVRPEWSMPALEWVLADPAFWRPVERAKMGEIDEARRGSSPVFALLAVLALF